MEEITLYTDGACSGNPGPGGWGSILILGENRKEISGGSKDTTNNIMVISLIACASVAAIGSFFFIRKRKEQN